MIVPNCPLTISNNLTCNETNCVLYAPKGLGCCIYKHKEAFFPESSSLPMSSFVALKDIGISFALVIYRITIRLIRVVICGKFLLDLKTGIFENPTFKFTYQRPIKRAINKTKSVDVFNLPLSELEIVYNERKMKPKDLYFSFLNAIKIEDKITIFDLNIFSLREQATELFGDADKLFPIKGAIRRIT